MTFKYPSPTEILQRINESSLEIVYVREEDNGFVYMTLKPKVNDENSNPDRQ